MPCHCSFYFLIDNWDLANFRINRAVPAQPRCEITEESARGQEMCYINGSHMRRSLKLWELTCTFMVQVYTVVWARSLVYLVVHRSVERVLLTRFTGQISNVRISCCRREIERSGILGERTQSLSETVKCDLSSDTVAITFMMTTVLPVYHNEKTRG